uniref:Ubiquitin-like protease family profile domain-containing protein n=1 Tax=Cajanus cajan TaxID=3821 RepID=A0A151QMI4_CAJCA|nr:hypothetical protein KK1_048138 [Cajanus cajan]
MDTQSSTAPQGSPAPTVLTSQATSKKKRKLTRMKSLARKRMKGPKISLDVDPTIGIVSGPNKAQFSSYLGTLARDKISILVPSWKEVPQTGVYGINDTNILKSKMFSSVATKFRQHKSYLTREWVHGKYKGKSPCDEYNIDLEEWEKFKEIRNDPSWKLVRKKAQDIQKLNNAPHLLSRGGYELLVRNFMKSEIKRLKEEVIQSGANKDVVIDPPPPPSCHRLWNMARTKSSGEMTSESANQVAEKIGIDGENIRVPPPDRSKPNSDPISDLREASKSLLYSQPFQVICPASLFGVNNHDFKLYISFQDIYELIQREMLNISIIQLWMLNHWQLLVLCPTNNVAIWFCSLHPKPNVQFKNLIKSVMVVYNVMSGRSTAQPKNLDWIYPMSNMQQGHYECGYYVMNWMLDIIEGEVTTDWIEVI